jgi:hypothetical protein
MVHAPHGIIRVGNAYKDHKTAKSWCRFISEAWHGYRVTVEPCLIDFDEDGELSAATRKLLDERYNLDC